MSNQNRNKGLIGEGYALEYLLDKGYQLVYRNWFGSGGEIDLIMENNESLVFVEVKWRSTDYFGYPEQSINSRKLTRMVKTANEYIDTCKIEYKDFRFDIIAITGKRKRDLDISHFEDCYI